MQIVCVPFFCGNAAYNRIGSPRTGKAFDMTDKLISILVPAFNEAEFLEALLTRVMRTNLPKGYSRQVIVVDDGSTDDTPLILGQLQDRFGPSLEILRNGVNQGKGYAVRRALELAKGEFTIIQDADLEYNPEDYPSILDPLVSGIADAVYGSRFAARERRRVLYFYHSVGSFLLTGLCNILADLNLTDVGTCYKAFRTSLVKSIPLRSNGFSFEAELTIKLAKRQARIYEVPISYNGRTYSEGKKVRLRDGFFFAAQTVRFGFSSDLYIDRDQEILDAFSIAPNFNSWMADVLRPHVGSKVLEIGAGIGNLTSQFTKRVEFYIASDINTEHLARLRGRLQHRPHLRIGVVDLSRPDDFENLASSVDTVICLNVLEHMQDDKQCVINIFNALHSGGRALILVPHRMEAYGALDVVLGHYRRYTVDSLRKVLEAGGFNVEDILQFNRISFLPWLITGRVLKRTRLSRSSLRLFDSGVWLWRRIDRYLPIPATSIIAIARKP